MGATDADHTVLERERLRLMPKPSTDTTDMLHMLTVLPHTDTDTDLESLDTQVPPPPSLPDPHRDLARDPLMLSTDTVHPDTESLRDTPAMAALSSKSQDCTKPIIYFFLNQIVKPLSGLIFFHNKNQNP